MANPNRAQLKSYDRVANVYDSTRAFAPGVEAAAADGLARLVGPGHVLEIGIGTGRIAVPLADRGVRIEGFDVSREMLRRLIAKRGDLRVVLAEAAHPPYRPASFDAALFVHVLHLLPDLDGTLDATLPLVRPGGVIVACVTDHDPTAINALDTVVKAEIARRTGERDDEWRQRNRNWTERLVERVARAGGWTESMRLAAWDESTTAREQFDILASKVNSNSWHLADGLIGEVIEAMKPEAERICGGLDVPVAGRVRLIAVVAHLP